MKNIIQYKVLGDNILSNLEYDVNKLLSEGWQPLGSCTIARTFENEPNLIKGEDLFGYYQTMVQYEE